MGIPVWSGDCGRAAPETRVRKVKPQSYRSIRREKMENKTVREM